MTAKEAKDKLIAGYINKFNQKPDSLDMLIIETCIKRVAAGENFQWHEDGTGNWRRIQFIKLV